MPHKQLPPPCCLRPPSTRKMFMHACSSFDKLILFSKTFIPCNNAMNDVCT